MYGNLGSEYTMPNLLSIIKQVDWSPVAKQQIFAKLMSKLTAAAAVNSPNESKQTMNDGMLALIVFAQFMFTYLYWS